MKIPKIFVPERKLDNKLEELLKEKPLKKSQLGKYEKIPDYAIQENGDYLIMRGGIILNTTDCKSITSSTFYFTIDSEEHKLYIGNKEVMKLDEKFVSLEENLISNLFDMAIIAGNEPGLDIDNYWGMQMKHKTEDAYKELSNSLNNGSIKPLKLI